MSPSRPYDRVLDDQVVDDGGALEDRATASGARAADDRVTDSPVLLSQAGGATSPASGFNRTVHIVENEQWTALPPQTRATALEEVRRIFAFVGTQTGSGITVKIHAPNAFPETLDFSEAVVTLTDAPAAHINRAFRTQFRHAKAEIEAMGIKVTGIDVTRVSSVPERIGLGNHDKHTVDLPGGRKLAIPVTAGVVNTSELLKVVVEDLAGQEAAIKARQDFTDENGIEDLGAFARYLASSQGLLDTQVLLVLQNQDDPTQWTGNYKSVLGKVLGRAIAHEARHQYVGNAHADEGLGAEGPDLLDDVRYGDFSTQDNRDIIQALQNLEREQSNATIVPTYPNRVRGDLEAFPF